MGKASKSSALRRVLKDKAMNHVNELQSMISNLQSARKESRVTDVDMLEGQVYQKLCEWKSELNEPSPASSLQEGDSWNFSSDIRHLMHPCEEEDDVTSSLAALKTDNDAQNVINGSTSQENFVMPNGFLSSNHCIPTAMEAANSTGMDSYQQYFSGFDGIDFVGEDFIPKIPTHQQNIIPPPPSAFLGPKCALWDCPRPALSLEWCQISDDYCSTYHATLAPSESYPGCSPIVRPKGIGLKDNLFFSALGAKSAGKKVGIPECEGAATAKSPWNAPELFDLLLLDGETIREWVFFDKPRKAYERGNRKQRSLPDYSGRGWHESRKQVMDEFGGLKRSYYMDPQPAGSFEWHLYEYQINACDDCALYRLEVKRAEVKKAAKGKLGNDSVADLQKKMNKLSAVPE